VSSEKRAAFQQHCTDGAFSAPSALASSVSPCNLFERLYIRGAFRRYVTSYFGDIFIYIKALSYVFHISLSLSHGERIVEIVELLDELAIRADIEIYTADSLRIGRLTSVLAYHPVA
jgi:hypothetical protein